MNNSRKNNYSRKKNSKKKNYSRKNKIGGLGTFFPKKPSNKQEETNRLANDIGRVQLKRIEKSLKIEFEKLKQLRKYCITGCKINSCMYNNKEDCDKTGKLIQTKSNIHLGDYCAKKYKNLNCRNYVSDYNKIKFYLNYIDNVNKNSQNLLTDFKKEKV